MKNIRLKNCDIVVLRNGEKYHYLHSRDGFIAYRGKTEHILLNDSGYLPADEYDRTVASKPMTSVMGRIATDESK